MNNQIKVLIVDDSQLVQSYLTKIIESDPQMCVVGCADDPYQARDMIKQYKPDVLTLDIEMPKMDGITFLKNLMRLHPLPVVMCSSLTAKGSDISLAALELGAIDYILKPEISDPKAFQEYSISVLNKVKTAAGASVQAITQDLAQHVTVDLAYRQQSAKTGQQVPKKVDPRLKEYIVAIGASTGGVEALHIFLSSIPKHYPPIVITQHIPHNFAISFSERLAQQLESHVMLAEDGQVLKPGHIYVSPGNAHFSICQKGTEKAVKLINGDPVSGHIPSVDVLFESVANTYGKNAIAALLTGMGADGAKGLKQIKDQGGYTLAQSKESCVVWGMPKKAVELDAVCKELPIMDIAKACSEKLNSWIVN